MFASYSSLVLEDINHCGTILFGASPLESANSRCIQRDIEMMDPSHPGDLGPTSPTNAHLTSTQSNNHSLVAHRLDENHWGAPISTSASPLADQRPLPSEAPDPHNQPKTSFSRKQTSNIDDHALFWSMYDKETGESDAELLEGWNKSLDILLIFAGLFSAINTAFIVESYKGLQPDPAEITNELLRLLITHRNDNITLTREDLNPGSPIPSAVVVNCIFFASLSSSLIAAFGAFAAKQWLTEYSSKGSTKPIWHKGRDRQSKYTGLETWHFRFIMDLLPMLLQFSLFLFLVGLVEFLWVLERKVAMVQLVLTAVGGGSYLVAIIIGAIIPASPFQMPLS
ncbi:hypothetical protein FRC02_006378, partial [Tulasnella sp. 418]